MRLFIFSLVVAGLIATGMYYALKPTIESKTVELFIKKTIDTPNGQREGHYICSGGFVSPNGLIMTAKHCVEGATEVVVLTSDQEHYMASVVKVSDMQDLALIRVSLKGNSFFELASHVARGDYIATIGNPLAIPATQLWGRVAKADGDLLFTDMTVLPGNSGGVVFNGRGQLVGIEVAVTTFGFGITGLSVSESLSAVREFLVESH